MSFIFEVVAFKLKPAMSEEVFRLESIKAQAFLAAQPGYVSRTLMKSTDGANWIDLVTWQSLETAQAAAKAFMDTPLTQGLLAMIDPAETKFLHCSPVPLS